MNLERAKDFLTIVAVACLAVLISVERHDRKDGQERIDKAIVNQLKSREHQSHLIARFDDSQAIGELTVLIQQLQAQVQDLQNRVNDLEKVKK